MTGLDSGEHRLGSPAFRGLHEQRRFGHHKPPPIVDVMKEIALIVSMTVTRWLKKYAEDQRRIRRDQPRVSSEEARKQFARVVRGSVSIGQNIKR
jgi:hypothetical protein